jgi:hypothetical protein
VFAAISTELCAPSCRYCLAVQEPWAEDACRTHADRNVHAFAPLRFRKCQPGIPSALLAMIVPQRRE